MPKTTNKITKDKPSQLSNGSSPADNALDHPWAGRTTISASVDSKFAGVRPQTFEACKNARGSPNFRYRYSIYASVPIGANEAASRSVHPGGTSLAAGSCP